MKKTNSELEVLENYIKNIYSSFGNSLFVVEHPYKGADLGYCYRYKDPVSGYVAYNVVDFLTGDYDFDLRVRMHEFGHIYLAHLDDVYVELDYQIKNAISTYKNEITELVNRECGIDYGDQLLNKVLDDPSINHEIHNVAMDMEVNSRILSLEDIDEMEKKLTELATASLTDEQKAKIEKNKNLVKLIHPSRYHFPDGSPFPEGRTYGEYLILIIKHLDQFVKMLVSIQQGGNGDTSQISSENVKDALDKMQQGGGQGQDGQDSIDGLMDEVFGYDRHGKREGEAEKNENGKPGGSDHGSDSRKEADTNRSKGQAGKAPGNGSDSTERNVNYELDSIDTSLDEIMRNLKSLVIKKTNRRDMMRLYNKGICRSVLAGIDINKTSVVTDYRLVFLIDVSGSMPNDLIDRCMGTIARKLKKLNGGGLKYDVITCNTDVRDHFKDIDPRKPVPRINAGGGTSIARGIEYFHNNYGKESTLIIISDFEDYMEEWKTAESTMKGYTIYGLNYGRESKTDWSIIKERKLEYR